jgi:hypothetical protein
MAVLMCDPILELGMWVGWCCVAGSAAGGCFFVAWCAIGLSAVACLAVEDWMCCRHAFTCDGAARFLPLSHLNVQRQAIC